MKAGHYSPLQLNLSSVSIAAAYIFVAPFQNIIDPSPALTNFA